ncbi:MAG: EAL domain-containing protein [Bacillota bacterium]|nr:EAL domain-containing protein [Bacillota bacterium]
MPINKRFINTGNSRVVRKQKGNCKGPANHFFKYNSCHDLKYIPLKISIIYLLVGFTWIIISDNILSNYVAKDKTMLNHFQTFKGWIYVISTAVLLYCLIKKVSNIIKEKEISKEQSYKELAESDRKLQENMKEIEKLAYYDSLTNLPNRAYILNKIEEILKTANDKIKFTLLFLDLDNFKTINDILGHSYGDQLLNSIGSKLRNCIGENNIIARLGGDEFLILLYNTDDKTKIIETATQITDIFSGQWYLGNKDFCITASIGVVVYPKDGPDTQTLYKNADTAMYQVKEKGKNGFEFFSPEMNEKVIKRLELENELRKAIKNEEFIVFYQPQVDIRNMQIRGFEALVRWKHPTDGIIVPDKFIPFAEESGLIFAIDEFVMRTAFKQFKKWLEADIGPVTLSVNLTCKQFQHDNFIDVLKQIINESGIEAQRIELEITERIVMNDFEVSIKILNELRNIGVRISLDDFGTGYSSLNYLKRLPIDTVKIDKSFINEITEDSKEEAIAEAIIALAHKMNLSVIAEGIETEKQLEFILGQNCDSAQGYYFSKPLPAHEVEGLLSSLSPNKMRIFL